MNATTALEKRLLAELKAKSLVVWLDADRTFTPFVDGLVTRSQRNEFPATVLTFRGSFLELMVELRRFASTLTKPALLLHLPGFNKESVRETPLLEIYEPAYVLELRLDSVVKEVANGRFPLAEIDRFVAQAGLTVAFADAWLAQSGPSTTVAAEWIDNLSAPELIAHLLSPAHANAEALLLPTRRRAETLFGTTSAWLDPWKNDAVGVIAWILCVEYVFDLRQPPKRADLAALRELPKQTVARCQAEAARLRREQPEKYRGWALDVEASLGTDETNIDPHALGHIDTFRFEALSIYAGAARALAEGDYAQVKTWADAHDASEGFWAQQEQGRRWGWLLMADAARLGLALKKVPEPLRKVQTLEEAVAAYAEQAAEVDRAHRHFEQRYATHYGPLLPETTSLDLAFETVRFAFDAWSNQLAAKFNALCRDHGALPPPELQQRQLFEQSVSPLLGADRTAFFVLDALRFEMALDLMPELKEAGLQVELRARMAELPTITAVGMNVLAPVTRDGRLTPVLKAGRFGGFKTGEATVSRPEDRVKAIGLRTQKPPKGMTLAEVRTTSAERLKNQVAQCQLLVVHGKELDDAGEAGFGVEEFAKILGDILAARQKLEQAGVTQFVFTADHGFLLSRGRTAHPFSSRGEAQRRYMWSEVERSDSGYLSVPLASLGYDGEGVLLFRDDTNEFKVPGPSGAGAFTHGGNSLQERVIPVLKAWKKRPSVEVPVRYVLSCERGEPVLGAHRLRVRVQPDGQHSLSFSAGTVDVTIAVPQRDDVRVAVKQVTGGGAVLHAGGLRLDAARADWAEVFFVLSGRLDERLPVEVSLLNDPSVTARPDGFFTVALDLNAGPAPAPAPAPAPVASGGWGERLGDPIAGKVFDYLEQHRALNEAELVQLVGGPRNARAFAARFDGFLDRITFEVEVVVNANGKQYRKR